MIYVDADACPVKGECETVGTRHKVKVAIVSNGGLRPSQNPYVETVIVPEGPDVADMWIADRAKTGDVVITNDIPLAAKCVEAGAQVLKHNGEANTCPAELCIDKKIRFLHLFIKHTLNSPNLQEKSVIWE